MAKHIKIGQPVNAAETWAFEFLEESHYLLRLENTILKLLGQKEMQALPKECLLLRKA